PLLRARSAATGMRCVPWTQSIPDQGKEPITAGHMCCARDRHSRSQMSTNRCSAVSGFSSSVCEEETWLKKYLLPAPEYLSPASVYLSPAHQSTQVPITSPSEYPSTCHHPNRVPVTSPSEYLSTCHWPIRVPKYLSLAYQSTRVPIARPSEYRVPVTSPLEYPSTCHQPTRVPEYLLPAHQSTRVPVTSPCLIEYTLGCLLFKMGSFCGCFHCSGAPGPSKV
ncbi:hypothetical protein AB205_0019650, partial [Aquarana catesbeiana]